MDLRELIVFKNWADEIYLKYSADLSDQQFDEVVPTIHKSMRGILNHILQSYWGEYHLITDRNWSDEPDPEMDRQQLLARIRELNQLMLDYIDQQPLDEVITYQEEGYEQPIKTSAENVLFNFVEHSSYHRGQMALLLRYHGLETIKQTNYNPYIWECKQ